MKLSSEIFKPVVFLKRLILIVLFIPFLFIYQQQINSYVSLKPLKGYFIPKNYYPITIDSWWTGEYQETTNEYLKEGFGFRNFLVRLNNQIVFWLFKKTRAEGIVVGKENYLYEADYIETYFGKNFSGQAAITDSINNLKFLQDTLKTMGKELLVVLAPSKARVYPEYIPDYLIKHGKINTNYELLCDGLKSAQVHFIDFNSLFLEKKKTSKHLLFPQLGVHWSRIEAVNAADSIINYIACASNTSLPRIKIKEAKELDTLQAPDNDIIEGMNVLFLPAFTKMEYPLSFEMDKKNNSKRNLIVISDSYWWDIYTREIPKNIFENNEFWYYNSQIFGNNYLGKTNPKKVDIKRHILRSDYIILMCTETNYSRIGFGFVGNAIKVLRTPITPNWQELNDIKNAIKNNKEWYGQVLLKASQNKLSADSMLSLDAGWYFQHKGPIKPTIYIEEIKALINTNDKWLKEIETKAKAREISVDSMITIDANWYINNVLNGSVTVQKTELTIPKIKKLIKNNPNWMIQIQEKAKARKLSVDSMLTLDAIWYIENEKKN